MNLGFLCGKGKLPQLLAEAHKEKTCAIVHLEKEAEVCLPGVPCLRTSIGKIGTILQFLREQSVDTIVMTGALQRPTLSEISFDSVGLKWSVSLSRQFFRGDDALLRGIVALLEKEGFAVVGVQDLMATLLTPSGILSAQSPTPEEERDIAVGFNVIEKLGLMDIGQAVVIQQGLVLGVEAIEGTHALITRCAALQRTGRGAILVKGAKPQQEMRVDLPTIGSESICALHTAGFRGVALEARKTILLDREEVLAKSNAHGLFVVGTERSAHDDNDM
ncbi:MAG: UDP-2,3-diacylglucosamine diphosphatase LpxI [Holosporales bacterium]|jgi:DUF1009 family protein|nr:UDP-2,3-diacylglucosamine diphosphatase LpxI [Holosporales bacterium]